MIETHIISSILIAALISLSIYLHIENRWLKQQASHLTAKNYALEEISSLKSTHLSMINHEIRTPISALIGIQQKILSNQFLPADDRSLLEEANNSARSLLEILNQNLDFSKIQAGKFELSEEACDLKNILNSIFRSFSESAKQARIELNLQLCSQIAESLWIDAIRLRQILHNLINNSIKFSPNGCVRINVKVIADDHFAQLIFFEVADTGKGIPHQEINRLRKPFEQLIDMKQSHQEPGTGLGLYITEHLLGLMNSQLELYSEKDQGTTASFTLALKRSLEKPYCLSDNNVQAIKIAPIDKNKTVLIVDDHSASQLITASQFKEMGYCVHTTQDAQTALQMMSDIDFDMVITDFSMPDMNGLQFAQLIHQTYGEKIKIFGLTAHVNGPDELLDNNQVFYSILTKPASIHDWGREIHLQDHYLTSLKNISLDYQIQINIAKEILATQLASIDYLTTFKWHKKCPIKEQELKTHLHKIKGGSKLIGDVQIEKFCQAIENRHYSSIHVAEKNLRIALSKSNRILRQITNPQ